MYLVFASVLTFIPFGWFIFSLKLSPDSVSCLFVCVPSILSINVTKSGMLIKIPVFTRNSHNTDRICFYIYNNTDQIFREVIQFGPLPEPNQFDKYDVQALLDFVRPACFQLGLASLSRS